MIPKTLQWTDDGLELLDQTLLPLEEQRLLCRTPEDVARAIKRLVVRGAPAIGVAAAYGVCLAAKNDPATVPEAIAVLSRSRPTAVNLFWALERMRRCYEKNGGDLERLVEEASFIEQEDAQRCRRIGEAGAALLPDSAVILTHCHAGALATAGEGTALSILYAAKRMGKSLRVFADETRPLLQGARITAWELDRAGIDVTLITDNMAAAVMRDFGVTSVIVGADRIALNGDTANKIGTYGLAVLANYHGIPFYVAAPLSTFDRTAADGSAIPIEERDPEEVRAPRGTRFASPDTKVYNPAFDVTPADLITALVTDAGVIAPNRGEISKLLDKEPTLVGVNRDI
ncbi:MAG: S-methyl-5-thioribose-1-phosphate isomerase [Candidatus Hydrogenedentota bacterium]|nr:MAG: S-methyl-5-thioribose-1-phosphate isomerase [Candidatus Hydrogenedentota bacterium]